MLLELVIICVVVVFLVFNAEKALTGERRKSAANAAARAAQNQRRAEPGDPAKSAAKSLAIQGTLALPASKAAFFKGYGLQPSKLCDARFFRAAVGIDEMPPDVSRAMRHLYEEGGVLGADAMAVIHHGRKLTPDEAVYFALTRHGPGPTDYQMACFVGRACA